MPQWWKEDARRETCLIKWVTPTYWVVFKRWEMRESVSGLSCTKRARGGRCVSGREWWGSLLGKMDVWNFGGVERHFCLVVYMDQYWGGGGRGAWYSGLVVWSFQHLTAVSAQEEAKVHCVNEVRHQCKLSRGIDAALAEKTLAVKCCDEQQTFPVHKSPSLSWESASSLL